MFRNHVICLTCFERRLPGATPVRFRGDRADALECCFCATQTRDGIFLRAAVAMARYCQCAKREAAREEAGRGRP